MSRYSHISVAIPILAEQDNLPRLLSRLQRQSFQNFTLYLCINNEEQGYGYDENQATLRMLENANSLPMVVIDRSSKGHGWTGKKKGVGWARKVIFERIMSDCNDDELVVSLDADTDFDDNYLEAVLSTMNANPTSNAFCVPYYHPLSGDDTLDRPMLRYECYMRHYLIQLLRIANPYAFTALGSAMAFPLWAYRRVGGITPLQGGEDFYLMQKFAKTGALLLCFPSPAHSRLTVRPQGRVSSRVPFGTGPAIAAGIEEMDNRYPFYNEQGFDAVKATYSSFPSIIASCHGTFYRILTIFSTKAPAAMIAPSPITASSNTVAPMPISAASPVSPGMTPKTACTPPMWPNSPAARAGTAVPTRISASATPTIRWTSAAQGAVRLGPGRHSTSFATGSSPMSRMVPSSRVPPLTGWTTPWATTCRARCPSSSSLPAR